MTWIGATILTVFTTFALMTYYSFIHLNLVFTHDNLETSAIPYYDSSGGTGHPSLLQVQRYRFEWWVFASDVLRIIPPVLFMLMLLYNVMNGPTTHLPYTLIVFVLAGLEFLKLAYRSWQYARCGFYQLCRNFDPTGTASQANVIWVVLFYFNLGFFIIFVVYGMLGPSLTQAGNYYYETEMNTKPERPKTVRAPPPRTRP